MPRLHTYILLLLPFLAAFGCGEPLDNTHDKPYSVLLITIDTLRADHLAVYGYEKIKTPHIDSLAYKGVRFDHAYTPCPVTLPAHTSILTGTYPLYHGVRNNGIFTARESLVTLAEALKEKRYATGAVIGAFVLDGSFGLNQGFDFYDDALSAAAPMESSHLFAERKGDEVTRRACAFMKEHEDHPFFLWVHYFDPHVLYQPPSPFDEEYAGAPYDGEIAFVDQQVGVLLKMLNMLDLEEEVLVVLTSDHGEGLTEHGEDNHGVFVYDSTLHVPLVFYNPQLIRDPKVIDAPVSLVDIMPTVLDVLNIETGPWTDTVQGASLVPLMTGRSERAHDLIYFETLLPFFDYGWAGMRGIRRNQLKYIGAPEPELYDTGADPKETANLFLEKGKTAGALHSALMDWMDEAGAGDEPESGSALEEETQERLSALGYSSGARHSKIEGNPFSGPDPKSRIWMQSSMFQAVLRFKGGQYEEALNSLKDLCEQDPENPSIHFWLGELNSEMGRFAQAENAYLQLLEIQPGHEKGWNNLGIVYVRQGRNEKAVPCFEQSLAVKPEYTDPLINLALIHMQQGDEEQAEADLNRAIAINAEKPKAHHALGTLLAKQVKYEQAILSFKKALSLNPNLAEALQSCARCFYHLGDDKQALIYLNQARNQGFQVDPDLMRQLKARSQ